MAKDQITSEFRKFRKHQRDIAVSGGGSLTVYANGRTELSYGSAPYGLHAVSAYAAAKRAVAFRQSCGVA